jgi:signal transduction histidine kinase
MRVAVPIFPRGRFAGFISGVVRVDELLSEQASDPGDYVVALSADDVPVYHRPAATSPPAGRWLLARRLPLPSAIDWTVSVAPSPRLESAIDTALPEIVFAAGLLLALALAVALRLAQTLDRRARELARSNRQLELEIEQRRQAEHALQRMARELEARVVERTRELAAANESLRVENQLRSQAQEHLARSNEDLRQFAAFVAHELRQPIAAAQVWVDVLETSVGTSLEERAHGQLEKLRSAIGRMQHLIEKELHLAQELHGEASMERVELGPLLHDVVAELRPRIQSGGARVEIADLPVIRADASLMRRLFHNLLENALKHPRPDMPLVVRIAGETRAGASGCEPQCQIRVEDNGRGFPPEQAERIFAIFARATDGEEVEGSGLGLAICRRIVERHGGNISAEGRPDGATFRVTLPADRCEEAAAVA